jgi:hypothetical protein
VPSALALWISLNAHLAKAGVHEHRAEPQQRRAELERRRAELELAGKDADDLKRFTAFPKDARALKRSPAFPEAVVYRWLYFREMDNAEAVLDELRLASKQTDHVYATFCYALTLYRRGTPGDLAEAIEVLKQKKGSYNDSLLPFVLAEYDYHAAKDKANDKWQDGALKAIKDYAERCKDGHALMNSLTVLNLLGRKEEAVEASQKLQNRPGLFYTLRPKPALRCVAYNADPKANDRTAKQLVQAAEGSQWDQCLAHFYVAMRKLAEGDRKKAKEYFKEVVKTRAFMWGAYDLSWVFLDRLKDRTWPRWVPEEGSK